MKTTNKTYSKLNNKLHQCRINDIVYYSVERCNFINTQEYTDLYNNFLVQHVIVDALNKTITINTNLDNYCIEFVHLISDCINKIDTIAQYTFDIFEDTEEHKLFYDYIYYCNELELFNENSLRFISDHAFIDYSNKLTTVTFHHNFKNLLHEIFDTFNEFVLHARIELECNFIFDEIDMNILKELVNNKDSYFDYHLNKIDNNELYKFIVLFKHAVNAF